MNQKKLKQNEATKNGPEKAIEQPVYGKTTVIRLSLEVLRYTCGQSDPLGTLTENQRSIHLDLPSVFTTREGLSIALQHSMSERTFKDWIKTATFKKLDYGTYEKHYK